MELGTWISFGAVSLSALSLYFARTDAGAKERKAEIDRLGTLLGTCFAKLDDVRNDLTQHKGEAARLRHVDELRVQFTAFQLASAVDARDLVRRADLAQVATALDRISQMAGDIQERIARLEAAR